MPSPPVTAPQIRRTAAFLGSRARLFLYPRTQGWFLRWGRGGLGCCRGSTLTLSFLLVAVDFACAGGGYCSGLEVLHPDTNSVCPFKKSPSSVLPWTSGVPVVATALGLRLDRFRPTPVHRGGSSAGEGWTRLLPGVDSYIPCCRGIRVCQWWPLPWARGCFHPGSVRWGGSSAGGGVAVAAAGGRFSP